MPDLYGAPTGILAAEQDKRAQQMHNLSMQKGELELQQARMEMARQKQMLELMKQQGGDKQSTTSRVKDLASDMDMMASIALQSGMPEKAKDFAIAGSTLRKNQREMISSKLNADIKEMDMMSSLLQNVNDDSTWAQANAMFSMQTGRQSPWAQLPYNPELVSKLQAGIQSNKDRALQSAAKAREAASRAQVSESKVRVDLIKAQTNLANARADKLRKTGTTEPKADDLRSITDLIHRDFSGAILPEEARVLARPVAERMLDLMGRMNLSKSEAAERAYQEAKAEGTFGGFRPTRQLSGSQTRPLDMPKDKAKLKPNMYYKGTGAYEGMVLLWTGTGFVQPPSPDEEDEFEEFPEEEGEE